MAGADTRRKREGVIGYALPVPRVWPSPDGSDAEDAAERAMLTWMYPGGVYAEAEPEAPAPSGAGGYYPYPRVPHRWPREKRHRKKLYDEFEEALEELADAPPEIKDEALDALEGIIGPSAFNVDILENRIEQAILEAEGRREMAQLRRVLAVLDDLIDEAEVEMLLLH